MSFPVKRTIVIANITWVAFACVGLLLTFSSIHEKRQLADLVRQCFWILVGLNFLVVALVERSWKYKAMCLNFFFVATILRALDLLTFFGVFKMISDNEFMDHYVYQYLSCGLIPTLQLFAVIYACLGFALRKMTTIIVYVTCCIITLPIAFFIYYPYVENAKYLYTVNDITDFRIIDRGIREFESLGKKEPEDQHLATTISLSNWDGVKRKGELPTTAKVERIREIRPYITGQNYILLLFKPIHLDVSLVNVLCVLTVLSVLLFQLLVDPPQSPYIDRMLLVLLIYSSFESLHYFLYSKTVEFDTYWDNFTLSALMSLSSLLLLPPVLWMRASFSASAEGAYYQAKIESMPFQVSRWRDRIDDAVLQKLIGKRPYSRRFVISMRSRGQQDQGAKESLLRKIAEKFRKNT